MWVVILLGRRGGAQGRGGASHQGLISQNLISARMFGLFFVSTKYKKICLKG
jgi:hypothetical protein